jgi:exopolysaccharide biosynthesis polyprenyl glycosylphosphotransferase
MRHKKQIIKYLSADVFSVMVSWILFYRYFTEIGYGEGIYSLVTSSASQVFYTGLIILPLFWVFLYFLWGFYRDVLRRSRLKELGSAFSVTLTGMPIVFIFLISQDILTDNSIKFFHSFMILFTIHFLIFYIARLVMISNNISAIQKGKVGFNTIIIGSDKKAVDIYKEINAQFRSTGNRFIGFININGNNHYPLAQYMKHLGGLDRLPEIISQNKVDEVVLAIESTEHGKIEKIINKLDQPDLVIKAIPALHDILTGRARINTIIETPLIEVSRRIMPVWQRNLKYTLDIIFSVIALIILLPVSVAIAIWIKATSKGPVIYSHERVGKNGRPFRIYKFRTMINNAEQNGPELSSKNDPRITRPGRFLRRTKLDEIPNFINVLKGDMSLVGPRPERRYYIDQIMQFAPHYRHLLKIKPGITSWGQVKYGYAENVQQMVQRLRYDIIYLENMSVFVDLQILILTLVVIFRRNGI